MWSPRVTHKEEVSSGTLVKKKLVLVFGPPQWQAAGITPCLKGKRKEKLDLDKIKSHKGEETKLLSPRSHMRNQV